MVKPTRPPANAFVAFVRKIYNPIGFAKGYNFVLWFIFAGALMGFTLSRFMLLDFRGIFCPTGPTDASTPRGALPGECFYYEGTLGRVGILLHLGAILPAAFLVVFQFVPAIRYKMLLFHRINGYTVIVLSLASIAGVIMIARHSFGGGLDVQMAVGLASIMFVVSIGLAYYNIKKLQIEQHRAWMLRAWFIASFIITMRLIAAIMAAVMSSYNAGDYYQIRPCAVIDYMYFHNQTKAQSYFPDCSRWYSGEDRNLAVLVAAFDGSGTKHAAGATNGIGQGPAGWLALALHAIGVEIYLRLTPVEGERLRKISYQRQLEAGMQNPGSAGLTVQRFGDAAPWTPPDVSNGTVIEQKATRGSEASESAEKVH